MVAERENWVSWRAHEIRQQGKPLSMCLVHCRKTGLCLGVQPCMVWSKAVIRFVSTVCSALSA